MRRQHRGLLRAFLERLREPLRRSRKTRDGVGVEHDRPLAIERGQDAFACCLVDADTGTDRERIEAPVGEKRGQLRGTVDRPHHDREVRGRVHRKRLAR